MTPSEHLQAAKEAVDKKHGWNDWKHYQDLHDEGQTPAALEYASPRRTAP